MFKHLAIAAVGSIALLAGSAANATVFNQGSLVISALTNTTSSLAGTTVFNLNPASFTLLNGTQDFTGVPNTTQNNTAFDLGNLGSFGFNDPLLGTFVATSIVNQTFNAATSALSFSVLGNYTTGTDFTNSGTTLTADEAFSLTQVGGPTTAISISATFFSPAQPSLVPEPMTMTLFGAGLAALGLVRRRK
jgi:hypothetical protein